MIAKSEGINPVLPGSLWRDRKPFSSVARQTGSKIRGSYDVCCDQVRDFSSANFLGNVYQLQSREHPRKRRGDGFQRRVLQRCGTFDLLHSSVSGVGRRQLFYRQEQIFR